MRKSLRFASIAAVAALSLSLVSPAHANTIGIVPGYGSVETAATGDKAYFVANAPGKGFELFVTDGTNDGARLVKDINAGAASAFEPRAYGGDNFAGFTNVGGKTVFSAKDASGWQLWVTDGTSAGTTRLTSEAQTRRANPPIIGTVYNGEAYFSGRSDEFGIELWKTDGTVEGTVVAADVFPGNRSDGNPKSSYPLGFGVALGKLFFYTSESSGSRILHTIDEQGALTRLASLGDSEYWEQTQGAVEVDGKAVFRIGRQTWESDGTAVGTRLAATGKSHADGTRIVAFDGAMFSLNWFSGDALELSKFDNGVSTRVTSRGVVSMAVVDDTLYYFGIDQNGHTSLYSLANAAAAPVEIELVDFHQRRDGYYPIVEMGGKVYFIAMGRLQVVGAGNWIANVVRFEGDAPYTDLAVAGEKLVIAQWEWLNYGDTAGFSSLWYSDGTSAGTYKALPAAKFRVAPTPVIAGTPKPGVTLRGGVGHWSPANPSFTYQWKADGVAIPGATGKYLTVPDLPNGTAITFSVTASLNGYTTTTKTSLAKPVVRDFDTATVTITGTKTAGSVLTADTSGWSPAANFTYQWFADGRAIFSGSTSSTYKVSATSQFKSLHVVVTGTLEGYRTATIASTPR